MAQLSVGKEIQIANFKENKPIAIVINQLAFDIEHIQKDGFEHFMLKEIFEQPKAIENT